jgi:hypothetical protein
VNRPQKHRTKFLSLVEFRLDRLPPGTATVDPPTLALVPGGWPTHWSLLVTNGQALHMLQRWSGS